MIIIFLEGLLIFVVGFTGYVLLILTFANTLRFVLRKIFPKFYAKMEADYQKMLDDYEKYKRK